MSVRRWSVRWVEGSERVLLTVYGDNDRLQMSVILTDVEAAHMAAELEREAHHIEQLPLHP